MYPGYVEVPHAPDIFVWKRRKTFGILSADKRKQEEKATWVNITDR